MPKVREKLYVARIVPTPELDHAKLQQLRADPNITHEQRIAYCMALSADEIRKNERSIIHKPVIFEHIPSAIGLFLLLFAF